LLNAALTVHLLTPLPCCLGALEQAITSHPSVTEACVVGIPDAMKGQVPFAFVGTSSDAPEEKLFGDVNGRVRSQVGAIASLGGMIKGQGMIPKTRSGKTLRRVLRELLENAVHGEFDKAVNVPSTVEDAAVVEVAREKIREYFKDKEGLHRAIEARPKL
jgi:propionyl-CoA synthetase